MSIESTIAELTAAVRELTAALNTAAPKEASPKAEGKPAKAEKQSSASAQKAADSQPTAAAKETEAAAAPEKAKNSEPELDFDKDVVPLFKKFVGKQGRDAALAFIQSYKAGASKLSEAVKPEQYAEVVAKMNEALA